jgi:hypothetical protein
MSVKKLGLIVGLFAVSAVGIALAAGTGMKAPAGRPESPAPVTGPGGSAPDKKPSAELPTPGAGRGVAALGQAAQAKKYLFLFFWKQDDEQTAAMRKVFDAATGKAADRAESIALNVTDPAEKAIVEKYMLDRAPMPLVLAVAPNGAITGGFPTRFEEKDLLDAFASPCTAQCMKLLQENKLVLLCVQNSATKWNDEAMKAVREFKADARFAPATEIVVLDPADKAEAKFLTDLKVDSKTTQAVTAFLVPPGSAIALFDGPVGKDALVSTLQSAMAGGCAGGSCGPGGCAPKP